MVIGRVLFVLHQRFLRKTSGIYTGSMLFRHNYYHGSFAYFSRSKHDEQLQKSDNRTLCLVLCFDIIGIDCLHGLHHFSTSTRGIVGECNCLSASIFSCIVWVFERISCHCHWTRCYNLFEIGEIILNLKQDLHSFSLFFSSPGIQIRSTVSVRYSCF